MSVTSSSPRITTAVARYHDGHFQIAAQEFQDLSNEPHLRKQSKKRPRENIANDAVSNWTRLMLVADAELSRARASGIMSDYERALDANRRFTQALRISSGSPTSDLISQVLLATVSEVWLHARMDQIDMARHSALECLQWAASAALNLKDRMLTEHEALMLLGANLSDETRDNFLRLRHALSVVNLHASQRAHTHSSIETEDEENDSTLEVQKSIVYALSFHGLPSKKDKRNALLERAAATDKQSRRLRALVHAVELMEGENSVDESTVYSLDQLASRASASEMNLLGCLLARRDLQLALQTLDSSRRTRGATNCEMWRETASNTAECLLLNGEPRRAKLILLESSCRVDADLTHTSNRVGAQFYLSQRPSALRASSSDLWRAYCAASLDQDHAAALAFAETLNCQSESESSVAAYAFALLQGQRPTIAFEVCQQHPPGDCPALAVALRSYQAQAALSQHMSNTSSFFAADACCLAMESAKVAANGLDAACSFEALTLRVCTQSNLGVAKLMVGDSDVALDCFRDAIRLSDSPTSCNRDMRPHFNLCLLLWRRGNVEEAASVWQAARQFNVGGESLVTTLQRTASMLRKSQLDSPNMQLQSPVKPWCAGAVHGIDSKQIFLMDCLVLQTLVAAREFQITSNCVDELLLHS